MQHKSHKILLLISIAFFTFSSLAFSQKRNQIELFQVYINDGFGFVNRSGEMVIKPNFAAFAGNFDSECNCIMAKNENNLWGILNTHGQWLVPPKYIFANVFSEGYVSVKEGKKFKFIDAYDNVLAEGFDNAKSFSDGLAAVEINKKWGYINLSGQMAIRPKYNGRFLFDFPGSFSEGLASVNYKKRQLYIESDNTVAFTLKKGIQSADFVGGRAIIWEDEKFGFIDITGKIILPPTYDQIQDFSEDLAAFRSGVFWGYLDKDGKVVIPPRFVYAKEFTSGLAAVKLNEKWGFIDKTGKFVIKPKYAEVGNFQYGLANVELDGKDSFIDTKGTIVFKVPSDAEAKLRTTIQY